MPAVAIALPRPAPGDYAPAVVSYIELAPEVNDAVTQLASQRDALAARLSAATALAGHRYAPGKWSVREVVGHLLDTERIFAYRLLRIARGDETPLAGFDENVYVPAGAFDGRTLADMVDEWLAARTATISLVRGLPHEAWTRQGTANGRRVTAAALLYLILGHVEHHGRILEERYGL